MEGANTIIEQIANGEGTIQTYAAKVIAVNREEKSTHNSEEAFTVNVLRSDGAEIKNVRLKASVQDKEQGVVCVPKLNSWVLVSIIETTETRAFISQYSEIEKIFLRIKDNENKFFELQSDVNSTSLLFKKEEKKDKKITHKNSTSLEFNGVEKALNVKFWNEEEENKVIHETTIGYDKVETLFINPDDDKVLQKTTLDATKVAVDFDEGLGYQTLMDKDKVQFDYQNENAPDEKLHFKMEKLFKVEANGKNLKDEIEGFIDVVSKIVVVQGTSPDVGKLITIKNNISKILE
ncbi:hypothetical protein [Tenacibaculum halocynthiae]|uniref:hypothetical protein n=1 Tax=Tenacibaculum halocynthiae TaxID=1254437 RepID=UPI00260390E1|nr:hypothetical protein [uncultured Tenacibaculum sp.]